MTAWAEIAAKVRAIAKSQQTPPGACIQERRFRAALRVLGRGITGDITFPRDGEVTIILGEQATLLFHPDGSVELAYEPVGVIGTITAAGYAETIAPPEAGILRHLQAIVEAT